MTPREELLAAVDRLRQRIDMAPWRTDTRRDAIIVDWLQDAANQHIHTGSTEISLWDVPGIIVDGYPAIRMARLINER